MRQYSVLPATLVVALVAASLPAQDPAWLPRLDALVQKRVAQPDAVGFSIGIAQKGKLLLAKGYGLADLEADMAANGDTMFRIGSVTKQFTAALILRAVEKGLLTLDDGLERFVEFPLQGKVVTIRHLLNHSSGIPSYTGLGEEWKKTTPLDISQKDLLAFVAGKPFEFEPGKGFEYNNTGYFLLGMVLEKLHGKTYAQIVHDELCAPLGLTRTRYDSNKELIKNRAQGYGVVDGKPANDDPLSPNHPYAAGSLLSSGGDLVRWSMALAGGKVVSAANYTAMATPLVVDGRDTHYGFGLMTGSVAEMPTVMHGGGIHGFNSFLLHVPQHDLHVAVISNSERANSQRLAGAIVRAVLDVADFVAKDLPLPVAQRDGCVGVYDFPEVGMALHVTVVGEKLQAKGDAEGQGEFALLFQGGREFRAAFDHAVKLEWSEDGKSIQLHQGGRVVSGKRR